MSKIETRRTFMAASAAAIAGAAFPGESASAITLQSVPGTNARQSSKMELPAAKQYVLQFVSIEFGTIPSRPLTLEEMNLLREPLKYSRTLKRK